jgi:anaerobic magnesium-protoporphyrin IX monomethyl ester cyclase
MKLAKPGVKLDTTERAFSLTKELGIITQAHVVLGWPSDTVETLKNTQKFLLKINPDVLNLNFLTPYPGTKMHEFAHEHSLLLSHDWSDYTSHKVVMRTETLTENQLYAIKNSIVRSFSMQKLGDLITRIDATSISRPRSRLSRARILINKILFPELD